jgi:hypothetical protein
VTVRLPEPVREVTATFLTLVDAALPGLVEGLYLHGSIGFGEWYDGRSDVDYVAVLAERPDDATVDVLRDVHARVALAFPRPPYDGFHVTWQDLARTPYDCPDVPCTQAGYFHEEARLDVHPVTWHELARHGVTVRGPQLDEVRLWTDQQVLREYTHGNLDGYWAGEVEALRRFPQEASKPDIVAWSVLGTTRLHHLLAKNTLTSKDGAGRYALDEFGERWRPLLIDALAARATGELVGDADPGRLGAEVIEFSAMVVETGLAIDP